MNELRSLGKISVIIPAYNEEKCLEKTLCDVNNFLTKQCDDFELIVVDDGSTDSTANVAREFARDKDRVRIIPNTMNQGKGAVVRQGLSQAGGEYLLFMDADHATHISELKKLPQLVEKNGDMFISSRYLPESKVIRPQRRPRIITSRVANYIIRKTLISGIRDTQNGFKIFSRSAYKSIEPWLTLTGWAFDIEMLYVARKLRLVLVEFPVEWRDSGDSRLRLLPDLRRSAHEYLRILRNIMVRKYPQRAQRDTSQRA